MVLALTELQSGKGAQASLIFLSWKQKVPGSLKEFPWIPKCIKCAMLNSEHIQKDLGMELTPEIHPQLLLHLPHSDSGSHF